jgi:N-acetylmuramoyl-L-alanine amidase
VPTHTVQQGECIAAIARKRGFAEWHDIWDHPQNQDLRRRRPNPSLLHPGDEVFVPERQQRPLSLATGKNHVLEVPVPKKELRLVIHDAAGRPLADAPWVAEAPGFHAVGMTDADGVLVESVPALLRQVHIAVGGRTWDVRVGDLNPLRDAPDGGASGVAARLRNLGFFRDVSETGERGTAEAIRAFQHAHGMEETGRIDSDLVQKLEEVHGS